MSRTSDTTNLSNCRVCGGKSEQVFVSIGYLQCLHVNSRVCKLRKYSCVSLKWNAGNPTNHLALVTMLSALRHGWGILALCVEVSTTVSQTTLVLPRSETRCRAVVTDDRARCDAREKIKALSFPWLHSQHQIREEKTVMRVLKKHLIS